MKISFQRRDFTRPISQAKPSMAFESDLFKRFITNNALISKGSHFEGFDLMSILNTHFIPMF